MPTFILTILRLCILLPLHILVIIIKRQLAYFGVGVSNAWTLKQHLCFTVARIANTESLAFTTSALVFLDNFQRWLYAEIVEIRAIHELPKDAAFKISLKQKKSLMDTQQDTVVLYIHGGGFCQGEVCSVLGFYVRTLEVFKKGGLDCDFVAVNYPLAPVHPFPAALKHCLECYRWATERYKTVILAGDSAGGNLVLGVLYLEYCLCPENYTKPAGVVAISPWMIPSLYLKSKDEWPKADGRDILGGDRLSEYVHCYLQNADLTFTDANLDLLINPGHHSSETLATLMPDTMLISGTADTFLESIREFRTSLKCAFEKSGNILEYHEARDMIHAFPLFPSGAPAVVAMSEMTQFIERCIIKNSSLGIC